MQLIITLSNNPVLLFKEIPCLIGLDSTEWSNEIWSCFRSQIAVFTGSLLVKFDHEEAQFTEYCLTSGPSNQNLLNDFWTGLLHSKWATTKAKVEELKCKLKNFPKKRKAGGGRKKTREKFPAIVEHLKSFIAQHSTTAHERRREETEELDTTPDFGLGFRIIDLLHCLYDKVDGFYEHGFDIRSCHHLFAPPNRGRFSSVMYHSVVNIKIGFKTKK